MDDLSRDLSSLYPGEANRIEIPEDVDADVRAAVRAGIRARIRPGTRRRPWRSWLAAASLLLAAGVAYTALRSGTASLDRPGDVDRSGKIDILDAFALSRLIEAGAVVDRVLHDINGDGVVDAGDVGAIATRAVALPQETS